MNLGNLSQRLSNLEASIQDLTYKFTQMTRDVTVLRSEFAGLREKTEPALQRIDQTVKGLQSELSQVTLLIDDSIAPSIDLKPVPASQPLPSQPSSRVPIEYDADGQPFIVAQPGHKEAAEAAGYSVIGIFTKGTDPKTYLKLRLGVQSERRQ